MNAFAITVMCVTGLMAASRALMIAKGDYHYAPPTQELEDVLVLLLSAGLASWAGWLLWGSHGV